MQEVYLWRRERGRERAGRQYCGGGVREAGRRSRKRQEEEERQERNKEQEEERVKRASCA